MALAIAFGVPRHARVGFTVGTILAAAAYGYRVAGLAGPVADTRGSPGMFLLLAFVLAISIGALITIILTLRTALSLARENNG